MNRNINKLRKNQALKREEEEEGDAVIATLLFITS